MLTRVELLRVVWGYQHNGYAHTLTTHMNRLRGKLERDLGAPRLIVTVRGLGYRFAPPLPSDGAAASEEADSRVGRRAASRRRAQGAIATG